MAKDPRDFWGRLIPGVGEEQITAQGVQVEESALSVLKDIRDALQLQAAGVPSGSQAPAPGAPAQSNIPYVLSLPFDPRRLTETIYAAPKERNLKTLKTVANVTVTVPAASGVTPGTYTITLTPPVGEVTLFVSPFSFTANHYSPEILVDLSLDGYDITIKPYEYSLANAGSLQSALYSYITQYAKVTFTNYTSAPSTVTATFETLSIDAAAFNDTIWLPQVREGLDALEATAKSGV